ncbi:MAG: hypothetical protein H5T59_15115, partial [Anaerolineae bacterium]|nr:hypothetical protein [Anaerolineae bacterium]
MGVITIDYDTLVLVAVLLFAGIGFFRGWLREGVTTVVLLVLVALLTKPELAEPIIVYINQLLKLILSFMKGGLTLDLEKILKTYQEMGDIFTPENPYQFLLWLTGALVALSYLGGRLALGTGDTLTPLSHLLGGLLGAFNGFIVISLVKEYLVKYVQNLPQPAAQVSALAAGGLEPGTVAIAVSADAQAAAGLQGYGLYAAIFL